MPEPLSTYRLFGTTLRTAFPFTTPLAPAAGPPTLRFDCEVAPPAPDSAPGELLFASPDRLPTGESALRLFRQGETLRLEFVAGVEFTLARDHLRCRMANAADRPLAEVWLLGTVFSTWLEWEGCPALHASAVGVGDQAVTFLAGNRGGKSSLAAAFLQAGYPLLTDDILALRETPDGIRAEAGYPQMRFWPHDAERLLGSAAGLAPVLPGLPKLRVPVGERFGAFRAEAARPAVFYLPDRAAPGEAAEIRITPLPPQAGLIELVRHAFTPRMADALGLAPARLARLARVLRQAPVRHLRFPDGYHYLPRVREAILADLQGLAGG